MKVPEKEKHYCEFAEKSTVGSPHHVKTGGQFEQDSAVLVQLLQWPVEQHHQIHVLLG